VIIEPIDTTKSRLRDLIQRRRQGLPEVDDDTELLERALQAIEELSGRPAWDDR
jgi:hypothetical protein